jgi:hypothetical protein
MKHMKKNQKTLFRRRASAFLAVIIVLETVWPTASLALTSGPSAPEFSSFEPVATTNMVNEFSGDFTYNIPVLNIPGPDGSGYAMSLSYHSGESVESEASWVGYGWTLNPGAINRGKRGFADDTKSNHIYYNEVPKNWTASVGASFGDPELFSVDIPISGNAGLRYNNYKGFGYTAGIGLSVKGIVSLGYSVSDGSGSFSAQVNPAGLLSLKKKKKEKEEDKIAEKYAEAKTPEDKAAVVAEKVALLKSQKNAKKASGMGTAAGMLGGMASSYGMHSFNDNEMPTSITPYTGRSFNVSLNSNIDPGPVPIGITVGLSGNYTQQTNEANKQRTAYGYLYSSEAYADPQSMMDYYTEKDSPFNKRDRYMGIPFSNADQYSITGEGLAGGFRLHSRNVGLFRPNGMTSKTQIYQAAIEFNVGLTIGAGTDVGVGLQTLEMIGDRWGNGGSASAFQDYRFKNKDAEDESFFFRFSNDLGGNVSYGNNDLVTALVSGRDPVLNISQATGINNQYNKLTSYIDNTMNYVSRSGRSSYIGYTTHGDLGLAPNGKNLRAYDKSKSTKDKRDLHNGKTEQIAEIATVNEDGNMYVYGMPVYSEHEKNISYSMESATVDSMFTAYKNAGSSNRMKVGTESPTGYATSHLLTQITTPDYVDRTLDGPTDDDFGGFTKFVYRKTTSTYHWRSPYRGYMYNNGDISNPEDDMGSFNSGDKEIFYLDTIYTKSHIAVFYRSNRVDGRDAGNDITSGLAGGSIGPNYLQKLDSICLFTNAGRGAIGKKIKKTCFKYNYSLCPKVYNATGNSGKLTLEAVWFEYDNIVQAKVSPYRFFYEYADPATYPFPYYDASNPNRFNEYASLIAASPAHQNPKYNPNDIDAWGNYQAKGGLRFSKLQRNLDQNPAATFDPAAWQLKRIVLPSGGEIHVQYEQDDYQYVQNRRAMALVKLGSALSDLSFELDLSELGYTSAADKQAFVDLINSELSEEKMYFKFLYSLIGNNTPSIGNCNSEYVSGYVTLAANGAQYNTGTGKVSLTIGGSGGYRLPVDICKDMIKKEKSGKINQTGNCDPAQGISDGGSAGDIVRQLLNKMGTVFVPGNLCMQIEPSLSYFKLPLLKAKKGGGLRVKRLLMYDPDGVDDGMAALYGTEYIYRNENGESSGVATNEPSAIREENPLITFLPKRAEQSLFNKAISGIDREQFEGPVGESILPSASVGYSRVVSKSIHSGKTNTGFIVSEFHTSKDYPYDMAYSSSNGFNGFGVSNTFIDDRTFDKHWLNIPAVFVNMSINNTWAAQGYRFMQNNMHGQPRSVSTYGGNYQAGSLALLNKSSYTNYEYFNPGEKIKVLRDDGTLDSQELGKEMEIVMETRGVEDITEDISTEFDASMGITPPVIYIPYFSGSGTLSYSERKMYTHVTSKVISFPAIQKAVTSMEDGITHRTENLVFSRYTGKPVQVSSTDGYDGKNLEQSTAHVGKYTEFQVPGYTQYRELGQKAISQGQKIYSTSALNVTFATGGSSPYHIDLSLGSGGTAADLCAALGALAIGDLLKVNMNSGTYYFHVDAINGTTIAMEASGHYNATLPSSPSPSAVSSLEIVRSGRTNQLNTNVGGYTVYGKSSVTGGVVVNPALKQAFAANLSTAIAGFPSMALYTSVTVPVPAGLGFLASSGSCGTGLTVMITKISASDFNISVYGSGYECQTPPVKYLESSGFIINETGVLKYVASNMPCVSYDIPCLTFCDGYMEGRNVIVANAVTMDHIWPYNNNIFGLANANNSYETGAKGKWRQKSSYAYKDYIVGGAKSNGYYEERNYKDAGVFIMDKFNWLDPSRNDTTKWVRTSTVTKYSPNGNAIEEKDAIHLYSTAKYGYSQKVPYLIAQNAKYEMVFFESFENGYGTTSPYYLEEKVSYNPATISATYAHAGSKSMMLGATNFSITETTLSNQMKTDGVSIKLWVKDPQRSLLPVSGNIVGTVSLPLSFVKIAQTGEWSLYEARVTAWQSLAVNSTIKVVLKNNITATPTIYIDDYVMHPLTAKTNSYVYDPKTLRLLTSFDDQHFGLYYQYNQEGKLVRKLIETERGMKTVTENQYNSPKITRPY